MNAESHTPLRQDEDRLPRRTLLAIAAVAVLVFAVAVAAAAGLAATDDGPSRHATTRGAPDRIGFVEQTLVLDANRGRAMRDAQERELARYRWIDRDAGVVAIPVERAIDLVAADPTRLQEVAP